MSIPVDLENLAAKLAEYRYGYLLTTNAGVVKAVTITATLRDGQVVIPTESRGSATNLADNASATLLFPPTEERGYSLIVDGQAAAADPGFVLDVEHAVLHRPAEHSDDPEHVHNSHCGHDCTPV